MLFAVVYADVVATIALILSAGSIGVQIWQWRKGRHDIRLSARQVKRYPEDGVPRPPEVSRRQLTVVTAYNRGRGPVDVVRLGFAAPDGGTFSYSPLEDGSSSLPVRLDVGQRGQWKIPTEWIETSCSEYGLSVSSLRPSAELGDGTRVTGALWLE